VRGGGGGDLRGVVHLSHEKHQSNVKRGLGMPRLFGHRPLVARHRWAVLLGAEEVVTGGGERLSRDAAQHDAVDGAVLASAGAKASRRLPGTGAEPREHASDGDQRQQQRSRGPHSAI
jgi:hypothetical protein